MRIAIPVAEYRGLESPVYGHFGSAPVFALVDSETMGVEPIGNRDHGHVHGACNPMKALDNQQVDAIVVGGIGAGALSRLNQMGIIVHQSQAATVRDNLALFTSRKLPVLTAQGCCGGHGKDGGCAH